MSTVEEFFNKNTKLAYWYLNRYFPLLAYDEDIQQEALLGLWKACLTYKADKGIQFTTYAGFCIRNQVLMLLRSKRKEKGIEFISLSSPLKDGDGLEFWEMVEDPEGSLEDSGVLLRDFISNLSEKEKGLLQIHMKVNDQYEGAACLGCSQAQYSRKLKALRLKIKSFVESGG